MNTARVLSVVSSSDALQEKKKLAEVALFEQLTAAGVSDDEIREKFLQIVVSEREAFQSLIVSCGGFLSDNNTKSIASRSVNFIAKSEILAGFGGLIGWFANIYGINKCAVIGSCVALGLLVNWIISTRDKIIEFEKIHAGLKVEGASIKSMMKTNAELAYSTT